jgi:WD40 repeat protein
LVFSSHFLFCSVRYWDMAQPAQPVRVIQSHTAPVLAVVPLHSADASSSADQHCFASGDLCGDVLIWDARSSSASPLASVRAVPAVAAQGGAPEVGNLSVTALSAHQNLLFVGSQDGTLAAFDLRNTSNALFRHAVHTDAIRSIAIHSTTQQVYVATASDDHFAQVHQIDGTQLTQKFVFFFSRSDSHSILFQDETFFFSGGNPRIWVIVLVQFYFAVSLVLWLPRGKMF